jgi:hypothetical protein
MLNYDKTRQAGAFTLNSLCEEALRIRSIHRAGTEDHRAADIWHEAGADSAADGSIAAGDLCGDTPCLSEDGAGQYCTVNTLGGGDGARRGVTEGGAGGLPGARGEGAAHEDADSDGAVETGRLEHSETDDPWLEAVYLLEVRKDVQDKFDELFKLVAAINHRGSQNPPPETSVKQSWIRQNAQIIALCSLPVALISVGVSIWNPRAIKSTENADTNFWEKVDARIATKLEPFRTDLRAQSEMLHEINGELRIYFQMNPEPIRRELKRGGDLRPLDFKRQAPGILQFINIAANAGIDVPRETIAGLEKRMLDAPVEDVPFLMAAITNLKSIGPLKRAGLFDQVANRTKPCIANPPERVFGSRKLVDGSKDVYEIKPLEFEGCVQVLDGTYWDNVKFTGCLLIYRGGKIGWGMFFTQGSIFRIELPDHPGNEAKDFVAQLLPQAGSPSLELKKSPLR